MILSNIYIFSFASYAIFMIQLLTIMIVLYIAFALVAWPVRYFIRKFKMLLNAGGGGLQ